MKVQFKSNPKMQYSVIREGIGYCEITKCFCEIMELNSGMEVSRDLLEESDGTLPDYVDVIINILND